MRVCVVHNLFIYLNLQDRFPVNIGSMLPIGLTPSTLAAVVVYCYSFAFGRRESTVIVNRANSSGVPSFAFLLRFRISTIVWILFSASMSRII